MFTRWSYTLAYLTWRRKKWNLYWRTKEKKCWLAWDSFRFWGVVTKKKEESKIEKLPKPINLFYMKSKIGKLTNIHTFFGGECFTMWDYLYWMSLILEKLEESESMVCELFVFVFSYETEVWFLHMKLKYFIWHNY